MYSPWRCNRIVCTKRCFFVFLDKINASMMCDSKPRCDIATVTIDVLPLNEDVVAVEDSVTTDKNSPVDIYQLGNDRCCRA